MEEDFKFVKDTGELAVPGFIAEAIPGIAAYTIHDTIVEQASYSKEKILRFAGEQIDREFVEDLFEEHIQDVTSDLALKDFKIGDLEKIVVGVVTTNNFVSKGRTDMFVQYLVSVSQVYRLIGKDEAPAEKKKGRSRKKKTE